MWSFYDTLILVTGLLTAAIAVLPAPGISAKTRLLSGLIGIGLVVLSVVLGSLSSVVYPSYVYVAPLIPLAVAGSLIAQGRKRAQPGGRDLQFDEQATSLSGYPSDSGAHPAVDARAPSTEAETGPEQRDDPPDDRLTAWQAVHDETTTAERLAQIAAAHPEFGEAILVHPNAYPDLGAWIQQYATAVREPSP